ncbi:MAG TPA: twin-arginine translocase subunit TatC, partial [Brevundimonas sp.]|nr:twin-arginine translocase subunit TatC [Brevundimonas sp.]
MSALDQDEAEIEASRAPLMDHLIELRGRLVICVVAFVLAFLVCFYFASPLYIFLVKPYVVASAMYAAQGAHGSPLELISVMAGFKPIPGGQPQAA